MSVTRRQHIINQAYLAHFCDPALNPPQVWVYEKEACFPEFSKYQPSSRTPLNVCVERDFYEGGDQPVNAVENSLSKIEGDFEAVVQNKILKQEPLMPEDNRAIAMYVSMMKARTTAAKANLDKFTDDMISKVEALEQQHGIPPEKSNELKREKANKDLFILNITQSQAMDLYRATSWLILVNNKFESDWHFITSDDPMCLYDFELMNSFYGIPAFSKTTEITLPITPKFAIVGNYLDISGYEDAHPNKIEEVNNRTLSHANAAFYSSRKLTDREMERFLNRSRQCLALDRAVREKVTTRLDILVDKSKKAEKIAEWMLSKPWLRWIFVWIHKRRQRRAATSEGVQD